MEKNIPTVGEVIAKNAKESISSFCFKECDAYCCRKGFLILTSEEVDLVVDDHRAKLEAEGYLKMLDGNKYSLNFSNSLGACPQLEDSRCKIHKNPKRPKTCDTYPVFINEKEKMVHFSHRCLAVREKKMYQFEHEFIAAGYKLD